MAKSSYYLKWYTDRGVPLGRPDAIHRLELARSENTVGVAKITVPLGKFRYEAFSVDQIIEVWRNKYNTNNLQNETAYFLRDWVLRVGTSGEELVDLYAFDANYLLEGAIVAYAAGSSQAEKTDYADDMAKEVVNENLGSSTGDADRTKISVASSSGDCPSISKAFSRRSVLRVCQDIADASKENGTYMAFDVVRIAPAEFEFRTYSGQRGKDHGMGSEDIISIGRQYKNLDGPQLGTFHRGEVNYAYAGGRGEGDARTIVERSLSSRINASAWNRREGFVDARNISSTATLQAEADSALSNNGPRQVISGMFRDNPSTRYNIDFGFGDLVNVEAFGYNTDCHVSTVGILVAPKQGEKLNINLRGEL